MYSETEEVAKILMEMLDDLATRLSVIDEVDEQAKKLVDDAYKKMIEWEKKLVVLANGECGSRVRPWLLPVLCARYMTSCAVDGEHYSTAPSVQRTWWETGGAQEVLGTHHLFCATRAKGRGAMDVWVRTQSGANSM